MRLRGGALALVVCAGLTGCTSAVAGAPARPGSSAAQTAAPGSAEAVLGDFATYDPCSVVHPAVFDEFGGAGIVPDRQSFETCPLGLTTGTGPVTISVGRLAVPGEQVTRIAELDGGWWIAQSYRSESACTQGLVFTDDVLLEVGAQGAAGADFCALAEVGVRMVADVLSGGQASHRVYPENSLALRDPCAMVTDEAVRDLPGFGTARRGQAPARHTCEWFEVSSGEATTLTVSFTVGSPPVAAGDEDEERAIAGRKTVVSPYRGESGSFLCTVSTAHVPSTLSDRLGAVELATVSTYDPRGREVGCASAVTVATEVWAHLPRR